MSRIEQLIAELCPDGVEFKELGEVGNLFIGSFVKKTEQNDNYEWPVYNGGISPTGYYNNFNSNKNSVVLSARGANCGFVNYLTVDFWAGNSCYVIKDLSYDVNSKFLFHYLKCNEINLYGLRQTSGIPAINSAPLKKFKIPIPPLPIQQEIVRILDTFTDLDAELQAELEARKKQYEHYRNQLLNFEGKEVEWKTLGEVGEFIRGNGLQKKDFTDTGVGCIHYGQIFTYYGLCANRTKSFVSAEKSNRFKKAQYGDLIIATTSENIEDVCKAVVWLGKDEIAISGDAYVYKHKQNPKYIAYVFKSQLFFEQKYKYTTGTKVIRVSGDSMAKFKIPLPPLSEQERIVSILDKFEALVNEELPAEIAARRKQYEYYREKLLAFEPLVS